MFSQYRVKIYSKQEQYGSSANGILRIELHWTKNEIIKRILGLDRPVELGDLIEEVNTKKLIDFIVRTMNRIIFRPLNISEMFEKCVEIKLVDRWMNDIYIKKLMKEEDRKFTYERDRILLLMKDKFPSSMLNKRIKTKAKYLLKN